MTPFGAIEDLPGRGAFMGNRGILHEGREIRRPWASKAWITCVLEFKGWRAAQWQPGHYTPLFFLDEATALGAGHRPCALCRRADYRRFRDAFVDLPLKELDATLHTERVTTHSRLPAVVAVDVPDGVMVARDGRAWLKRADALFPWSSEGYGAPRRSPKELIIITPPSIVTAIRNGYVPMIHGTAL